MVIHVNNDGRMTCKVFEKTLTCHINGNRNGIGFIVRGDADHDVSRGDMIGIVDLSDYQRKCNPNLCLTLPASGEILLALGP